MKIQKMVSLDAETARLASMKLDQRRKMEEHLDLSTSELLYHLEQKSAEEIKILVQLLKNGQ